jgi:hypothetical protein
MAKYRIVEERNGVYAQEKATMLHRWRWLDNRNADITWDDKYYGGKHAYCSSLEEAKRVIEKRIAYVKEFKKYPKIHKYKIKK